MTHRPQWQKPRSRTRHPHLRVLFENVRLDAPQRLDTHHYLTEKKWERFYAPLLPEKGDLWINGEEAHHMLHVKRLKPGERLLLFAGNGGEAGISITQAFSAPKGKRSEFLVQKCCELGVRRLIPLECERSVVKLAPE